MTLRRLWASGYQVILSYDSQTAAGHRELWPPVPYLWANRGTAQGVIRYLDWHKDLGRPGELDTPLPVPSRERFRKPACPFSQAASSSPA